MLAVDFFHVRRSRPPATGHRSGGTGRGFRPGDKVIQIRNNYDRGAFGTVGTVTTLSVVDRQLTVRTDEDEDTPLSMHASGWSGAVHSTGRCRA